MSSPSSPLDETTLPRPDSGAHWNYSTPVQTHIAQTLKEPDYIRLLALKKRGWIDTKLESDYQQKRRDARSYEQKPSFEPKKNVFFHRARKVMEEMDIACRLVPKLKAFSFLDVCCCPGGFSQYILQKNRSARGRGISLAPPVGHQLSISGAELERFEITYQDVTRYDFYTNSHLSLIDSERTALPTLLDTLNLHPLPDLPLQDLVIADGQVLRDYNSTSDSESFLHPPPGFGPYTSLLYAQLVLALLFVRPGGTIIYKETHCDRFYTIALILKLQSFATLTCYKPTNCWADRSSFYVILKDVRSDSPECRQVLEGLVTYMYYLTISREVPRELNEGWGREAEEEAVQSGQIAAVVPMFRQVWKVQADGLEWKLDHAREPWGRSYNGGWR